MQNAQQWQGDIYIHALIQSNLKINLNISRCKSNEGGVAVFYTLKEVHIIIII